MAARDRISELYSDPEPDRLDLAALARESQEVLLEQLRDRFDRVVDAFVQYRLGANDQRSALLGVLFDLYDEGLLTKAEVRERAQLEPEDFYDELRAHRLRRSNR